jgi:hypothetical protein
MQLVPARRAVSLAAVLAAMLAAVLAVTLAVTMQAASAGTTPPGGPKPPGPGPVLLPIDQCAQPGTLTFSSAWEAQQRKAVANAQAAEAWLRTHPNARRVFAGRWFSVSSQHGAYHVAFTLNAAAYEVALRKVAPYPDRMCVSPAVYTLTELEAVQNRIDRDVRSLVQRGVLVNSLAVNDEFNVVVVALDRSSAGDAAQVLRRRYAGLGGIKVEFGDPAVSLPGKPTP